MSSTSYNHENQGKTGHLPEVIGPPVTDGRNPMEPFDSALFPKVGIMGLGGVEPISGLSPVDAGMYGLRPVIGVKAESPGDATDVGANMARLEPAIKGMKPIPTTNTHKLHLTSKLFFLYYI